LADIQKDAKVGSIYHRGEAGGSEYWLCYTIRSPEPTRVWFSSWELGGYYHAIENFYVSMGDAIEVIPSCPELPKRLTPVLLDNSIWLGSDMNMLENSIGRPSAVYDKWRFILILEMLQGLALRHSPFWVSKSTEVKL
jgi:hypothetical protein